MALLHFCLARFRSCLSLPTHSLDLVTGFHYFLLDFTVSVFQIIFYTHVLSKACLFWQPSSLELNQQDLAHCETFRLVFVETLLFHLFSFAYLSYEILKPELTRIVEKRPIIHLP